MVPVDTLRYPKVLGGKHPWYLQVYRYLKPLIPGGNYLWYLQVNTCGNTTSKVDTCWVVVRTLDFSQVPEPAGKNLWLSLAVIM